MHHKSSRTFIELKTSHMMNGPPCGNQPQRAWSNHWIKSRQCRFRIKWESYLGPESLSLISLWWRTSVTKDTNHYWIQTGPIFTELPKMTNWINFGRMLPSSTRLTRMRKSTWAQAQTQARTLWATGASTGESESGTWAISEWDSKSALWMPSWKRSNNLMGSTWHSHSTRIKTSCEI